MVLKLASDLQLDRLAVGHAPFHFLQPEAQDVIQLLVQIVDFDVFQKKSIQRGKTDTGGGVGGRFGLGAGLRRRLADAPVGSTLAVTLQIQPHLFGSDLPHLYLTAQQRDQPQLQTQQTRSRKVLFAPTWSVGNSNLLNLQGRP